MHRALVCLLVLSSWLCAAPPAARAHVRLVDPPPRYPNTLKDPPCGLTGGQRSTTVTELLPGATITVVWDEYINHPAPSVLLDNIADGLSSTEVTLPNVQCDNCTLQLIQVMYDKPPWGDGNDIYYQCADLVLTPNPGSGGDSGGCACRVTGQAPGGGFGLGPAALSTLALGSLWWLRRRRR